MNYYHYTDINGLKGILENKEIWLTDTRFLNDSTEGEDIYNVTDEILKDKNREDLKETCRSDFECYTRKNLYYTASFSENSDSLSQWRGYCPKVGGYVIGFNFNGGKLSKVVSFFESDKEYNNIYIGYDCKYSKLIKCIYNNKEKKVKCIEMVDEYLEYLKDNSNNGKKLTSSMECFKVLPKYKMVFKNDGFVEEKEVRIIVSGCFDNIDGQEIEPPRPFFRVKSNYLVPYLKMKFNPKIVTEIIIGPTENTDLAKTGLQEFIRSLGPDYKHIKINHSSIPYRSL